MNENQAVNYALALKNYSQNGRGRLMKRFSEDLARHNTFMFSLKESSKMNKLAVADYLMRLLEKFRFAREGDDLTGLLSCKLAT